MNLINNMELIGWFLIASGIVFIVSFFFLFLMFKVKTSPFGPLNDITYVLALLLISPFLFGIYQSIRPESPGLTLLGLAAGLIGLGIIAATQIRLVVGKISLEKNMPQGAFGSGLLGIAFIIDSLFIQRLSLLPDHISWLGLATGILMAMGIFTGLFYGKEEFEMMSGRLDWKNANPLALIAVFSSFLGQLGLVIWVFWSGGYLIIFWG